MIPNKVTGAGNIDATMAYKVKFSKALSSTPKIEAWDNSETFPAVGTTSTTTKEIFTGTAGNGNKPMLAGYIGGLVGAATKPGSNWHPASATAGAANPNLLKGNTNYVMAAVVPGENDELVFNLSLRVPYDATVPSTSSMNALIRIVYNYTGVAPDITLAFNEGTETVPSWTDFTAGTNGIRFCNAEVVGTDYKLTLPEEGQVYAGSQYVTI